MAVYFIPSNIPSISVRSNEDGQANTGVKKPANAVVIRVYKTHETAKEHDLVPKLRIELRTERYECPVLPLELFRPFIRAGLY